MATSEQLAERRYEDYLVHERAALVHDLGFASINILTVGVFGDQLPAAPVVEQRPDTVVPEKMRRDLATPTLSQLIEFQPQAIPIGPNTLEGYAAAQLN